MTEISDTDENIELVKDVWLEGSDEPSPRHEELMSKLTKEEWWEHVKMRNTYSYLLGRGITAGLEMGLDFLLTIEQVDPEHVLERLEKLGWELSKDEEYPDELRLTCNITLGFSCSHEQMQEAVRQKLKSAA